MPGQTWGAAIADFSNQSPNSGPRISAGSLLVGDHRPAFDANSVYLIPLALTPDSGHTMATWHAEVPPMLTWMTNILVGAIGHQATVRKADLAARTRRKSAAKRRTNAVLSQARRPKPGP